MQEALEELVGRLPERLRPDPTVASQAIQEAGTISGERRDILRTSAALELEMHPRTVCRMRDAACPITAISVNLRRQEVRRRSSLRLLLLVPLIAWVTVLSGES